MAKFRPDPNQPRRKFNLKELAASLKAEGIKTPLIVRSPDAEGIMMIADGERRWRASEIAEITELPYVIDDSYDKLTQLIVNMQREDNTPDEKAATILELEAMGVKRAEIARRMGRSPAFVTELADFAKLPAELRALYDQERCTDVTVLNLLRRTYDKHPQVVLDFIADEEVEINRRTVNNLAEALKRPAPPDVEEELGEDADADAEPDAADPDASQAKKEAEPSDRFKRPVVHVTWNGKPAVLLVNRRCGPGKAWVKFEDGKEKEVRFSSVQNVEITEG